MSHEAILSVMSEVWTAVCPGVPLIRQHFHPKYHLLPAHKYRYWQKLPGTQVVA
ncbi:hypothetical protein [Chlorogloeopsis fritschii]|uniref:hypothetical protein n=1 Tax=Chlorogloeopsis fritschii TaxID=1124 RepID=UPI0012F6960C|nr:hypothetical protein [Chlorogloeopsis fritschii]